MRENGNGWAPDRLNDDGVTVVAPIAPHRSRGALGMATAVLAILLADALAVAQWPQWGGPNRNFVVETDGLADRWPEGGPTKLWHRELGDGYSAIVVDHGVLYTMYGEEGAECTVALNAKTGRTRWVYRNPAPFKGSEFGPGPHATPVISGNRLFTVGANAIMHCFDKKTGEILWKHDFPEEFGAPIPQFGYACSPIAYKNLIIAPVDRKRPEKPEGASDGAAAAGDETSAPEGQSLMAFDQADGRVVWKSQDFPIDYSSPILINFRGEDQLVLVIRKEIIGVDPSNGELRWHYAISQPSLENIATPVWNGEDMLFLSAAYDSGSRVIKLVRQDGKTVPREMWYSRKMRIHHGNAIQIGDYVYGSNGDSGSVFFMAMNLETGRRVWADRNLKKVNGVYGDGKLITLDEQGELALVTVTPEGLTVHSKCKIAEHQSWTAPTLVGTTLFVRDRKHIMALDVG